MRTKLFLLAMVVWAGLRTPASVSAQTQPGSLPSTFGSIPLNGPSPLVVEDSGPPYRTAVGYQALFANTTGVYNTATGHQALYFNTAGSANTATGRAALLANTGGGYNTATGDAALFSNITGSSNTATGRVALLANTTGDYNTATGDAALYSNTTGRFNTALGLKAGYNATTGSYNMFLGAEVEGSPADTNTIRIGLPYGASGTGQNRAFIAGIVGTPLTGAVQPVWIDANGQLGTLPTGVAGSGSGTSAIPQLQQQVKDQQATIAELKTTVTALNARLARVEALLAPAGGRP